MLQHERGKYGEGGAAMQSRISEEVVTFETLSTELIALMFSDYARVVLKYGGFDFQIPREVLIVELERMSAWLNQRNP